MSLHFSSLISMLCIQLLIRLSFCFIRSILFGFAHRSFTVSIIVEYQRTITGFDSYASRYPTSRYPTSTYSILVVI